MIENLTRPNGVNTTWAYEAHRNLVTQMANGGVSTFGYVNDALGRRTSMSRSGSAFTVPDVLTYGYNDRSEVISAQSNVNAAYNYSYNYDPIGNRNTANLSSTAWTYTSNNLNQYTQLQFGATTQDPTYDFDGNMLTRDGWTQTWNGENRLIQAVKGSAKLQFAYDYMGRRVEKKVYDGESLTKHTRFVYNGYKLVEELDALNNNATLRKYTWQPEIMGLDVPLSVYDAAANTTYFYTTDANKNVSDLTDSAGAVVAHYEYSPFGVQTKATGAYAESNPFRFSSEYFDAETGLVYYNYRYYSPDLGRWLSRDPIAEQGCWNLYGMTGNDCNNYWDELGQTSRSGRTNPSAEAARRKQNALNELANWSKQKRKELSDRFKKLCPEDCPTGNGISKKSCEDEADKLSNAIVDALENMIRDNIDKFGSWPFGGNYGNILNFYGGNGYRCDQWADAVEKAIETSGSNIFGARSATNTGSLNHTWTEIYGPGNSNVDNENTRGDFGIDLWPSGGRDIRYSTADGYTISGGNKIPQDGANK